MKKVSKLVKRGWFEAMTHQGTLSLILTLDDFLISGPFMITDLSQMSMSDPNIYFIMPPIIKGSSMESSDSKVSFTVTSYFILRPYIRGILYGLNPFYQISLYVPCKDSQKKKLYQKIISRIDIGGQFFQDRIYWNLESLQNDILDPRLACLIYSGNLSLTNDWLRKISIETRPFNATIKSDLTKCDNLFDLVEIRSFLEDVHQLYFGILQESKKPFFSDTIRSHAEEKCRRGSGRSDITNTSGFYSPTTDRTKYKLDRPFSSDNHFTNIKKNKSRKEFLIYKAPEVSHLTLTKNNTNSLLDEYEDIIQEQLKLNQHINDTCNAQLKFAKTLCRWNTITQRKSDILKLLMNQDDIEYIHQKLQKLNDMYCLKKSDSENDLFISAQLTKSNESDGSKSSGYIVISDNQENKNEAENAVQFTTRYTNKLK